MKKNVLTWNRYFWWPVIAFVDWVGEFINQCPPAKKVFHSPRIQNHPWPKKFQRIRNRIRPATDAKGPPHSETKIFNHPRR